MNTNPKRLPLMSMGEMEREKKVSRSTLDRWAKREPLPELVVFTGGKFTGYNGNKFYIRADLLAWFEKVKTK